MDGCWQGRHQGPGHRKRDGMLRRKGCRAQQRNDAVHTGLRETKEGWGSTQGQKQWGQLPSPAGCCRVATGDRRRQVLWFWERH